MIAGQGTEAVVQTILAQKALKRDYIANTKALHFTDDGTMKFTVAGGAREYTPTQLCIRQIGDRVGIPAKYLDRMRNEAPGLLAANVNHWFQNNPEKRMLRALENGSNIARAFLSEKYRPLDNIDIAGHVLPFVQQAGCEIKSAAVTDNRLYIQAIIPRMERAIAKVGDLVQSGVVISNSEVGAGSLRIEHMIYTLRCTNGMIGQDVVRRSHVGRGNGGDVDSVDAQEFFSDDTRKASDKAFWMKVQDLTKHALSAEMFENACLRLDKAAAVEIEKPTEVIELVSSRFDLQSDESEAVLKHFIAGGRVTQYGLLNAITRTAEDAKDYDRAIELERIGGEVLLLPASDFSVN